MLIANQGNAQQRNSVNNGNMGAAAHSWLGTSQQKGGAVPVCVAN